MHTFKKKVANTFKSSLVSYLQARDIFFPKASSFGVHEPYVFRRPFLNFRERSFQVVSFGQQGEDLILNRIFQRRLGWNTRKRTGFYMDVGAFHPISHSTSYCLYKFGWSGVCVDLSKETCSAVKKFRPRDYVVHCAIAKSDERQNAVSADRISLTNEVNNDVKGNLEKTLIDSRSISSILDEVGKVDRVDYLNIDVEGAELAALEGLDYRRHRPKVISIEIHARDMLSALDTDVAKKLLGEGYVPIGCAAITYFFAYDGDLV